MRVSSTLGGRSLVSRFFRQRLSHRAGPSGNSSRPAKLLVELLEDRRMPSFIAPLNYDSGPDVSALAVGDFNGDGVPDLVALNSATFSGTPSLSVFLGNGDGTFQPAVHTTSVFQYDQLLVVANLTTNGLSDVVTTVPDGNLGVFLSNGDGTFQAPLELPGTASASSVAAADLTGSGITDLVASANGTVYVFMGNGDGTFQAPTSYTLLFSATAVVVGDFTGDGIPDIVARDAGSLMHAPGFDLLVGNGDGTFQNPIRTEVPSTPSFSSLVAADLNHDGKADLVFLSSPVDVSVCLNNGDGTFQAPVAYYVRYPTSSVTVMDVNGDGNPDLVVVQVYEGVKVLLGNGDGTFSPGPDLYHSSDIASAAVFADLNGDGIPDMACSLGSSDAVGVRLGNPDGTFQTTPNYAAGQGAWGVAVGDFTGTGITDVAVTDVRSGSVIIFLGNGDGTFQAGQTIATGAYPTWIVAGDFNGDHRLDLVVADDLGIQVFLGNGDGTFRAGQTIATGVPPVALIAGDFNGDGKLDLVFSDDSGVKLLLGNGDGTFQAPSLVFATSDYDATHITVGDFNGDHRPDLAISDVYTETVYVLQGNGDGTFQPARSYYFGTYVRNMTAADLTGAGRDALVVSQYGDPYIAPGFVNVLLSNPDGTLQSPVKYQVGVGPEDLLVADFAGTGVPAIAVHEGVSVRVLLGNGDGTFQLSPIIYSLGGFSGTMVTADVNGDSQPDIVAPVDRGFSVLLNSGVWHAAGQGDSPLASLAAESSGTGSDELTNYLPTSSQERAAGLTPADRLDGGGQPRSDTGLLGVARLHQSVSTEPEDAWWFGGPIHATLIDDAFADMS
jgi:hypothetical protein